MFDRKTKEDWINQIQKELKGKIAIEELNFKIDEISLSPISHIEKLKAYTPIYRKEPTKAGICIENSNISNETILNFLSLGAMTLKINVNEVIDLSGVLFEMIEIHLNAKSNLLKVKHTFHKESLLTYGDDGEFTLVRLNFENDFSVEFASKIKDTLEQRKLYLEITLSDNFYKNICGIRALRVLMANISKKANHDFGYLINVNLPSTSKFEDEETALIAHTYKCMASYIGGADYVFQEITNHDFDRTSFHIQNLITLESKMNQVQDPVCGSPFFEELTEKMVQSAWERMNQPK
jgi:hypothetical protein